MTAAWAGVLIAALIAGGGFVSWAWRAARREGKIDALLERLVGVGEDHEDRIRHLEQMRLRQRSRPPS
jgi:hypothetical protein